MTKNIPYKILKILRFVSNRGDICGQNNYSGCLDKNKAECEYMKHRTFYIYLKYNYILITWKYKYIL